MLQERRVYGNLEHPKDGKPDLNMAAIVITNVSLRENGEVWGTMETLSNLVGVKAQSFFKDGLSIGISSRAHGSVQRNSSGIDEVQEDFMPESFDLVSEPSTPGAYLHESLLEEMKGLDKSIIKADTAKAIFSVQAPALQEEALKAEKWDHLWEARLNDLRFFAKSFDSDASKKALTILQETISAKKELYGGSGKGCLREKPDQVSNEAKQEVEVSDPEVPKEPVIEKTEGSYSEIPVSPAKTCHSIECNVDFERLAEPIKKKVNVFRPGEDLSTMTTVLQGDLESSGITIKAIDVYWEEAKVMIKIELDGDTKKAKECVNRTFLLAGDGTMPKSEAEPPKETPKASAAAIAAPEVPVTESVSVRQARKQFEKELREENRKLRQRLSVVEGENTNLRTLNHETQIMFESEIIRFETAEITREHPELKCMEKMLKRNRSIPSLHEMVKEFLTALSEKTEVPKDKGTRRFSSRKVESQTRTPLREGTSDSRNFQTPGPSDLKESFVPKAPVSDGTPTPKNKSSMSRLAKHRARKAREAKA